jgi:dipeptidyl aminopeptidase/acylaminoacyl peptidase
MTRKRQAKAYFVLMRIWSFFVTLIPLTLLHAQILPLRPLIPRAILFGQPEHSYPQLSHDGLQIAYERNVAGVTEVWVRTLGTNDDHAVTAVTSRDLPGDKGNVANYFWHADGRHIFYQREPQGNDATARLYILDLNTHVSRDLTPYDHVSLNVLAISPDQPNTVILSMNKRDGGNHSDVYSLNVVTGETTLQMEAPDDLADNGWSLGADLVVHGMAENLPNGGTILSVRSDVKSRWRELLRCGPEDGAGIVGFEDDYRTVWVMSSIGSDFTHIDKIDVETGARTPLLKTARNEELGGFWTNPETHRVDLIQYQGEKRSMVGLDKAMAADLRILKKAHAGVIDSIDRNPDATRWIVTYRTDGATWWYLYDRANRIAAPIYSEQPALDRYHIAGKHPIRFHARDGMLLHGYVSPPVDAKKKERLPMVILVHGGPERRDEWGYDPWPAWLADRGYAVLQINFRASDGFGKQYRISGYHQWSRAMRTDILDGKAWAVQHKIADPKRICIMGGSYGGYATLIGLTFTPSEYTCGMAFAAPTDLALRVRNSPHDNDDERELGADVAELEAESPVNFADRLSVPLLIAQGSNDHNVTPEQAEKMVEALRSHNKKVDFYLFPKADHGFVSDDERFAFFAVSEQFLARQIGGRVEPITASEAATLSRAVH